MTAALLNHLWQSTVFAAVIALIALSFRKNAASVRYWLWWSASVKFLIPFALLMSLGSQFEWTPRAEPVATPLPQSAVVERFTQAAPVVLESVALVSRPFPEPAPLDQPPSSDGTDGDWAPIAALAIWACGFVAIACIRLRGWLGIRAALDSSTPLDIGAPVPVRSSPGLLDPGIVGWFRPALLMPAGIEKRLTPAQLAVVIAHEMFHIRRRDNFTAGLHMVVEALFWFHPLVWWIGSRLVAERERACDEAVLELGREPLEYAEAILAVCKHCVESPLVCVSGIKGSDVKKRIEVIIRNSVVSRMSWTKKAVLAVAATIALAAPILVGVMTAGSSRAQSPGAAATGGVQEGMEISGVVLETGTTLPVPDAELSVVRLPDEEPRIVTAATMSNIVGTATSDLRGRFVIEGLAPGEYRVQVRREGYIPPTRGAYADVIVDADDQNPASLQFFLSRPGEISGRLVERDSEEPVAALLVTAFERIHYYGRARILPRRGPYTDAEGRFVIAGLAPGDYVIRTGTRFHAPFVGDVAPEIVEAGVDYLETDLSEQDTKTASWDYEQGYRPGGPGLEQVIPVSVISGSRIDLGDIALRRTPVYSVHVSLVVPSCTPDETLSVDVRASDSTLMMGSTMGRVSCGEDFVLRGFQPGSYRLELTVLGYPRDTRPRGSAPFTIVAEDVEIAVPVALGVDVEGEIVTAEGSQPPDYGRIQLALRPVTWRDNADTSSNPIDGEGRFRLLNVAVREQQLSVSGLSPSHYLKEVRYNGHTVSGDVLTMDSYAGEHSLEIVVDDRTASVSGSITDGDEPADRPLLVLARWPLNPDIPLLSATIAEGAADGTFHLAGLAPGEYRVVAVPREARESLHERAQLDRVLRRAEELTLAPSDFKVLMVELTERW